MGSMVPGLKKDVMFNSNSCQIIYALLSFQENISWPDPTDTFDLSEVWCNNFT